MNITVIKRKDCGKIQISFKAL